MRYILLSKNDFTKLSDTVNQYLKNGWKLHYGHAAVPHQDVGYANIGQKTYNSHISFSQAMTKDEKK